MESKIKNYEDACALLKRDPAKLPDVSNEDPEDQDYAIANFKLRKIAKALILEQTGKEWRPNYANTNERKYFAWFEVNADADRHSGFGFSFTGCDYWFTFTHVGSRLCFPSAELALYFANNYTELHIDNQLYKN